ncbi:hypothetical protein O0L34_g2910 [Tuta absoluta]|nr:hypothetical protein O0L34_g2910 [Tuta absoluta]
MLHVFIAIYACVASFSCEPDKRVITSLKYSKYHVQLTVVNGIPTEISQLPYLVSIKEPLARRGKLVLWANLCGASIISRDGKLLTAAHCFESNKFAYVKRPYVLRAVHGSPKTDILSEGTSGVSKEGVQWRTIEKAVLHHGFNFPVNDIAIAFVEAPWTYSETVAPIALAKSSTLSSTDNLGECYLAGYGKTGHGDMDRTSPVLLTARIVTISRRACSKLWGMSMDKFVCSSSLPWQGDASRGDSGGPLWCERLRGRELTGVVSGKSYDKTTLFTRVSAYSDWIHNNGVTPLSSFATKPLDFLCSITCIWIFYLFLLV